MIWNAHWAGWDGGDVDSSSPESGGVSGDDLEELFLLFVRLGVFIVALLQDNGKKDEFAVPT